MPQLIMCGKSFKRKTKKSFIPMLSVFDANLMTVKEASQSQCIFVLRQTRI